MGVLWLKFKARSALCWAINGVLAGVLSIGEVRRNLVQDDRRCPAYRCVARLQVKGGAPADSSCWCWTGSREAGDRFDSWAGEAIRVALKGVMPAQAGIQNRRIIWAPAFAGVTINGFSEHP